jgi:ribosomal protein L37AE/L43A|tara:strand:- start:1089 stop:1319 length:231 start_codon:yes stop_codon:yes gene_type:complete
MELKMMECPKCGNPMPIKRKELGYHVCINCSTESAKRGVPIMRGSGDHTWVDLEIMTQDQFEKYKKLDQEQKKKKD